MLDGPKAANRMLAMKTNLAGWCLNTVWQAYGSPHSLGRRAGQSFPTAIAAYDYASHKHSGTPPKGVPVYFDRLTAPRWSGDTAYPDGDVCISLGGGRLAATDYPSNGRIGVCTIAQRAAQTRRRCLGWTGDFLGNNINYTTTASQHAQALPKGNDDMQVIKNNTTGLCALVGPQFFAHMPDEATLEINYKVWSTQDELHRLSNANFYRITRSLGIPDDEIKLNNLWSRDNENREKLDTLMKAVAALTPKK